MTEATCTRGTTTYLLSAAELRRVQRGCRHMELRWQPEAASPRTARVLSELIEGFGVQRGCEKWAVWNKIDEVAHRFRGLVEFIEDAKAELGTTHRAAVPGTIMVPRHVIEGQLRTAQAEAGEAVQEMSEMQERQDKI